MKKDEIVFSFDIGTGSLGEAVRSGKEIVHAESLKIPSEFASTKEQTIRRRFYRTRLAHKAREKWLKKICRQAGIEVLEGRNPGSKRRGIKPTPGDPRLEREFPAPGDDTVYTSCLLRIMLLRGEKLEGWQVYKALHSAIQRRGYDPDIPWKSTRSVSKKDDEKENTERIGKFFKDFEAVVGTDPERRFLCYYDAAKIGLWDRNTDELSLRIDNSANRARGYVAPRSEVQKELRALIEKAASMYPKLKGKTDYILYGRAEQPYASSKQDIRQRFNLKRGGETDWEGVLGQKIPRFDNRILNDCALIPRFHVCRASEPLYWQVCFLLRLINLRYRKNGEAYSLTPSEVNELFAQAREREAKKRAKTGENDPGKLTQAYKLTRTQWVKWCKAHDASTIANNDEVPPPKVGGRSRFCRPALRILRDLILSGNSPRVFREEMLKKLGGNEDPSRGLVAADLDFLLAMPEEWEKIHVPSQNLESITASVGGKTEAIKRVIGGQKDPVVRHRLEVFWNRLQALSDEFGEPDTVVLEFVREDFMGPKARRDLEAFNRKREKERRQAEERASELDLSGRDARLRVELFHQQGGCCLYTGRTLPETGLGALEIEHIVPRRGSYFGPDAMFNKVLTFPDVNKDKGSRIPFEWPLLRNNWEAYQSRVLNAASGLGKKKVNLLLSENAPDLAERYTSLAETAWISRLAQTISHLQFGWKMGGKGERRRVVVVSGGLTARIRRKFDINSLLAPEGVEPALVEKKVRDDDRHHALDAMVISYIPGWAADSSKRGFFRFPAGVHKEYFRGLIEKVVPRFLCVEKPTLEATIYAKREIEGKPAAVVRKDLVSLPFTGSSYSAKTGTSAAEKIVDPRIRSDVLEFFRSSPTREQWENFVAGYRLKGKLSTGCSVKRVALRIGELTELEDLSKDASGQYRKGSSHQGYYVYLNEKEKPKVRPVYAYESRNRVLEKLRTRRVEIVDFFYSNCTVEIARAIDLGNRVIPSGKYTCSTIFTDGRAKLRGSQSYLKNPIGLEHLLAAGFKRVSSV